MEPNEKSRLDPKPQSADDIFGYMADKVKIVGDIVSPMA
jgi:hypothetical protein